ncbi:MAG: DUF6311 domain-containing protein, partial [Chloroflexota bacterium]|nr:DUF6311 domain-containing protein [Chloroflexota bacterium]
MQSNKSNFLTFLDQKIIKSKITKFILYLILSGIVSVLLYLFIYHRYPIYFTNVNWIYQRGGDTLQHQLGWEFFRNEPWHFPIGKIVSFGYPFGTNLTFLDSIPLMAIPFKILSPLLESRFQYFGLWELISIFFQYTIAIGIIREFTNQKIIWFFGALLLVFSPPLISRAFGHSSLTAHWIILVAIWFCIRDYRGKKQPIWFWPFLFFLAFMIHIYFVPMLLPLWAVSMFFKYRINKKFKPILLSAFTTCIVVIAIGFCLGIFSLGISDLEGWGYGHYSWNMNGFINPHGASSILRGMKLGTDGQYEGFSYLGLGIILLSLLGFSLYTQKDFKKLHLTFIVPFVISSMLYSLIAITNKGFLNERLIWDFALSDKLLSYLSVFRASGRFIWPVFYLICIFSIAAIIRNTKRPIFFILLAIAIQIIDIQPLYTISGLDHFVRYEDPLSSQFWQSTSEHNKNILIYPANGSAMDIYGPLAGYAEKNNLTLNWGYFARSNKAAMEEYAEEQVKKLEEGKGNSETLYIFYNDQGYQFLENLDAE